MEKKLERFLGGIKRREEELKLLNEMGLEKEEPRM